MKYIVVNGDLCISRKNNVMHITNDLKNAYPFGTEGKAQNFIQSMPKKWQSDSWSIRPIGDDMGKITAKSDKKASAKQDPLVLTTLSEKIREIEGVCKKMQDYEQKLNAELSKLDLAISDLEHAAELCSFDKDKAFQFYQVFRKYLVKRRKVKDELAKINYLWTSTFRKCAEGNGLDKFEKNLDSRKYQPRVLSNLFDEDWYRLLADTEEDDSE